ncbi:MAG: SCO family protein [Chthoniobacterales bacterium]
MKRFTTAGCLTGAAVWAILFVQGAVAAGDRDYDYEPPPPGSYQLPVIKPAAGGPLIDSTGKAIELRDLTRGRVTVMSFIYTRCSASRACPYATNVLGQLHLASSEEKELANGLRLLSISFDPEYDTPRRLASYADAVRDASTGCEWQFLTGRSEHEIEPILAAYGQTVDKRANAKDADGPLSHVVRVFLIDQQGRIRNIYSSATLDPRLVIADVKTLLGVTR